MNEKIVVARASHEDAERIASLYNEVYEGHYPLAEYMNPTYIREAIARDFVWYVGYCGEELIGSTVGVPEPWNNSIEIGRTVVKKVHNGKGVAKTMSSWVSTDGIERGFDMIWGTVRRHAIYKIAMGDSMTIAGYFPGRHKVEARETHLLCLRLSERARAARVAPPRSWLYDLPVVQEILSRAGARDYPGPRIQDAVVGPPSTRKVSIDFEYNELDESALISAVPDGPPVLPAYLQVTVLSDKLEVIEFFLRLGFTLCGFLPAWFLKDGRRYDCVVLANCTTIPALDDAAMNAILRRLMTQFQKPGQRPVHRVLERQSALWHERGVHANRDRRGRRARWAVGRAPDRRGA